MVSGAINDICLIEIGFNKKFISSASSYPPDIDKNNYSLQCNIINNNEQIIYDFECEFDESKYNINLLNNLFELNNINQLR